MVIIRQDVRDEANRLWLDEGNIFAAIKYLRNETGFGLKESKLLVEQEFSEASLAECEASIETVSIGDTIDKILYLTKRLTECYADLESVGYVAPKK